MFCWQCEQTKSGSGCDVGGVCGKKAEVADLQDLLRFVLEGLAEVALAARANGYIDKKLDRFTVGAVFSTITNVEFDPERIRELIVKAVEYRDILKTKGQPAFDSPALTFKPAPTLAGLIEQAKMVTWRNLDDQVVLSLRETVVYGLKGLCAYADHAAVLGCESEEIYSFVYECLALVSSRQATLALDDWLGLALKVGQMNLVTMKLLSEAHTGTYGHPTPTSVPLGAKAGRCILVSGHDLKDLQMLLEQTAGLGLNIYTHGEMLPAHGYPELKKQPHLYGHYGTAWQNQAEELPRFPGPVLFTTNCIQRPAPQAAGRIYTTGLVGWPGLPHIAAGPNGQKDFRPLIEAALALPGFTQDEAKGEVLVGFGHQAVLGVADKVVAAVKSGQIRRFMLVAGCDGAKPGRNYYTDMVDKAPKDAVILTLACGKFRFFDHKLGDIGGIPRLLDMGQCNDAYSAVVVAQALAEAFGCALNDLPLSFILSWYEQKACAILLTLLYLGVKNIHLGPSLPAFIHPEVLTILADKFGLRPIGTAEDDLAAIFA